MEYPKMLYITKEVYTIVNSLGEHQEAHKNGFKDHWLDDEVSGDSDASAEDKIPVVKSKKKK
jgi:hypothetical protein